MVEQEHDSLVLCLFVHAQVISSCKFLTTLVAHSQWMRMRMRWGWLNRSLRAWWSLLSGWTQLYLLWPSQASLYRRPIHQHPFFSLQQPAFHLSLQYILAKQWVCLRLCFCFAVFSLVLQRQRKTTDIVFNPAGLSSSLGFTRCQEKRKQY